MHVETQFSIFLINKPGVLARTLSSLATEKINIIAMTMVDSVEHGVLRLITAQPAKARQTLARLNIPVNETEVICVNISNRAGALADIATRLADAHININYAYCTAGARGGRTTGVLKVADVKKAVKVLEKPAHAGKAPAATPRKKLRPSPGRRAR